MDWELYEIWLDKELGLYIEPPTISTSTSRSTHLDDKEVKEGMYNNIYSYRVESYFGFNCNVNIFPVVSFKDNDGFVDRIFFAGKYYTVKYIADHRISFYCLKHYFKDFNYCLNATIASIVECKNNYLVSFYPYVENFLGFEDQTVFYDNNYLYIPNQ